MAVRIVNRFLKLASKSNGFTCRELSQYYPIDESLFGLNEEQTQVIFKNNFYYNSCVFLTNKNNFKFQFRQSVFNFVQKELAPKANEIDKKNTFDELREFFQKLGGLGLLGK